MAAERAQNLSGGETAAEGPGVWKCSPAPAPSMLKPGDSIWGPVDEDQEPGRGVQIKGQQVQRDEKARIHHQKPHVAQSSQQMLCDGEEVTELSGELHRNQVTERL